MLKAYASYFVSYLLDNLKEMENIQQIILFGSVAKNEATRNSDVDIFIEVKNESKKFSHAVDSILENFYKSREGLSFKIRGIDNKINIIIGHLEDWKDLKVSLESTGIMLYGRYIPAKIEGRKYAMISWDNVGKNRGAFLNKIYGFKVGGKSYSGLVERLGGRKIGKSSIMVPIESREEIIKLLKPYQVNAKIIEIYA